MSRTISGTNSNITLANSGDNPVTVADTVSASVGGHPGTNSTPPIAGAALYGVSGIAWTISNSGLIHNKSTYEAEALQLGNSDGRYVNQGVIVNQTGGQITGAEAGITTMGANSITNSSGGTISAGGAGTVTNAGTITDGSTNGSAVLLATGLTNQVIVDPGAVFIGIVDGGTPADATLVLASAAGAGTLTATNFTDFGAINFNTGSQWTLIGGRSALAGTITGFAANNTIDLTGFAAVSETFASNASVLTDSAASHATLAIQGSFTTANFTIASDGEAAPISLRDLP
jgi:hypothetical protein